MDVHVEELECSPGELICNYLDDATLYEQLAEECAELAHAALKTARILRGENPTPVRLDETHIKLVEEFNDVVLVANLLHIYANQKTITMKEQRWINRILAAKNINKEEGEN